MCGIVGYIGSRQALPVLLDSLERVTYRGYDSFGVAVLNGQGIDLFKQVGSVDGHRGAVEIKGNAGIGHTRWATVGEVSQRNAHPHTDCTGGIAIVHNGDIDNYQSLRDRLLAEGHSLASETDSELIAHLVENHLNGSLATAVRKASEELEGSYATVVLDYATKELVITRNESPVVVGIGDGEAFVASDAPAILSYTDRVLYPEDRDIVLARPDGEVKLFRGADEEKIAVRRLAWSSGQTEKNGYEHFMLKEIYEQPTALRDTLSAHAGGLSVPPGHAPERSLLLACGTSYHAALYAESLLANYAGVRARACVASEYTPAAGDGAEGLVVAISQSGETADTLAPIRALKSAGHPVVGITNVPESSLDRLADTVLRTAAGPEVAVASTKTLTAQMALLALLAAQLADGNERAGTIPSGLRSLPGKVEQVIARSEELRQVGEWLAGFDHAFIVAKGAQLPVALEAALKLKEVAYMHAEGVPAGELKHGPFALLSSNTPVLAIVPNDEHHTRMVTTVREVSARGAPVVALVGGEAADIAEFVETLVPIPEAVSSLAPIVYTVAAQLISYYCGKARGCPIDRPRNLAKSVTVH